MPKPKDYLTCPMKDNDSGYETVGGYLTALLVALFEEGEGFSGKRPFGNSGWEDDVAEAWMEAGLLPGDTESWYAQGEFLKTLRRVLKKRLKAD